MKAILATAVAVAALAACGAASAQSALFECRSSDEGLLSQLTQTAINDQSEEYSYDVTTHYAPNGLRVFGFVATALSENEFEDFLSYEYTLTATLNAAPTAVVAAAERALGQTCVPSTLNAGRCYFPESASSYRTLSISLTGAQTQIWCSEVW